jgi:hypothetical protein
MDCLAALTSLRPGCLWRCDSSDYSTLEWDKSNVLEPPTLDEINVEIARLKAQEPWLRLRKKRNSLLAETDWTIARAIDKSNDGFGVQLEQAWVDYRQALRDLPANTDDPENPVWPAKPGG